MHHARDSRPAHVLHALAPLWPPLYTALEWATQQTRAYFDAKAPPRPAPRPSLVRYQAKRQLARWAMPPRRTTRRMPSRPCRITASPCPTAGNLLYVLRILKALEGQLPALGPRARARPSGSSS